MSPPSWWMAQYVRTANQPVLPTSAKIDCPHTDRRTFARGACQRCYFAMYRKAREAQGQPLYVRKGDRR